MSVQDKMTAIADAIRDKTGDADPLSLDQMAVAIAGFTGGYTFDLAAGEELPGIVAEGRIFVVTSTPAGNWSVSTNAPESPAVGDMWIKVAEGAAGVVLSDQWPKHYNGLTQAAQWDGTLWHTLNGYIGVSGAWVQFALHIPPVGTPLENYTWEQIDNISRAGFAADYFQVGDTKSIYFGINTYLVEIIDFVHDDLSDGSGKAGITFCMKDCLSDKFRMNATGTTAGGWGGSEFRGILQSTIFGQLPYPLRAVIKTVTKKTSAGSQSTTIVSSADTLFILAEKEVFGLTNYSVEGEGKQYSRFVTTSTWIKYRDGRSAAWWLRSPRDVSSSNYCYVTQAGDIANSSASVAQHIVFGFCI